MGIRRHRNKKSHKPEVTVEGEPEAERAWEALSHPAARLSGTNVAGLASRECGRIASKKSGTFHGLTMV